MSVGGPSKRPCYVCGQHRNNIIEPVSHNPTCIDHRKYFLRWEKIRNAIFDWKMHEDSQDLDEMAKFIDKALK